MARRSMINRGSEVRVKGKSIGRDSSGARELSFQDCEALDVDYGEVAAAAVGEGTTSVVTDQLGESITRAGALSWRDFDKQAAMAMVGRAALMLMGIAVMALGIDIVVKANLGNSPISAFPYVMSHVVPQVSFGSLMLLWQCFLVLLQIVILRREFRPVDLLQIPISVFFGVCIDAFMVLIAPLNLPNYACAWVCLLVGMAILALGVTMTVISATVMNCGEAVVQAVVRKTGVKFGTMKVVFDVCCAVSATLLALICLGHLEGVREGTVVCAVCTGLLVNAFMALYNRFVSRRKEEVV